MGDDTIYGGDNGTGEQTLVGGYGNDKIISGSGSTAAILVYGDIYPNTSVSNPNARRGAPNDGDDLIDMGDNPDIGEDGQKAFGQGGNDKIIGGLTGAMEERLYGGDGDDKIWAENPGQVETNADANWIWGNNGNDIIYGSVKRDRLYGDWARESTDETILNDDTDPGKFDTEGGDDIIYTGIAVDADEATGGDYVHGGWGNDKIYGQGIASHRLYGEFGDDFIVGGDGGDYIYGDDYNTNSEYYEDDDTPGALRFTAIDAGVMFGDDTLYGGKGSDTIWAGAGDDYLHGEDGQDVLYAGAGDDTLWGGDGDDYLFAGTGWDTVFGGDGCDYIYS